MIIMSSCLYLNPVFFVCFETASPRRTRNLVEKMSFMLSSQGQLKRPNPLVYSRRRKRWGRWMKLWKLRRRNIKSEWNPWEIGSFFSSFIWFKSQFVMNISRKSSWSSTHPNLGKLSYQTSSRRWGRMWWNLNDSFERMTPNDRGLSKKRLWRQRFLKQRRVKKEGFLTRFLEKF